MPGAEVRVADPVASRRTVVESFGAAFDAPDEVAGEHDVVFHTSATSAGLRAAMDRAGTEARVVEASWFGDGEAGLPLGGPFHSRRLTLLSSQVGALPPDRRPRWTHARRLSKALDLLGDDRLDALISDEIAFADSPSRLPDLLLSGEGRLMPVIRYF
jgi:hypothetical protein